MFSALHSVVVHVRDFDRAIEDHAAMLGRRAPAWISAPSGSGARRAFFPLDGMTLEICDPGTGIETGTETREGLAALRLALGADSEVIDALTARGVCVEAGDRETIGQAAAGPEALEWTRVAVDRASSRSIPIELIRDASPWPSADRDPSMGPGHVLGLDHVVVLSADLEATRAFYAECLGLRLALDRSFEARGVRLLFFRVGGVTIEIAGRLGVEPQPDQPDRFGGLAWRVDDAEAIQGRLSRLGFDVSEVRAGHKPGTRVLTVRDRVHTVPTLLIEPVSR